MDLSRDLLNKISDIVNDTKDSCIDNSFYHDIFNLLKDELSFLGETNLFINSKESFHESAYLDTLKNNIYINTTLLHNYINNLISMLTEGKLSKEEENIFFIYVILWEILHEVTHVNQLSYATSSSSIYPEINKLYNRMYNFHSISFHLFYKIDSTLFFQERNADMEALKIIIELSPPVIKEYLAEFYLFLLFDYKLYLKNKILSPARKSFSLAFEKYDIISEDIPLYDRLNHGLDISISEYKEYIEANYLKPRNYENYKNLIKKIEEVK